MKAVGRSAETKGRVRTLLLPTLGGALAAVGLLLAAGGLVLVILGGSWYYLIAGSGLLASGMLLVRADVRSVWLFLIVYVGSIAWSAWEAGLAFWPQVPRLGPFLVMGAIMGLVLGRLDPARRQLGHSIFGLHLILMTAGVAAMFYPHGARRGETVQAPIAQVVGAAAAGDAGDWRYYGRDAGATHFAPFRQITHDNVKDLRVAWVFRTGEINDTPDLQATPLQVGDTLYLCTAHNRIFAVDADTGRRKWAFDPGVKVDGTWNRCRGVGYYAPAPSALSRASQTPTGEPPRVSAAAGQACRARILATTVDARLLALDAATGRPCEDFGDHGIVDLKRGLGPSKPGWYYPTSAPLVAGGRVIVGGWVSDNQSVDEPGGVVRAFDAETGALIWAWDPGRNGPPVPPTQAEPYARSTPNFWGTATFDEALGLVFIPTGSGTPDHWGGKRTKATDTFSTSVVALHVDTGAVAWRFQAVHHDLWDWDLSAPPTFADMPDGKGGRIPAIIQVGKSGQVFVLDRRTGRPVTAVVERKVPQGAMPGDRLSPTQPYSIGMPQVIPTAFSEKTMWGATFLDQLYCRIRFRMLRYEGQYTPPSLRDTPITPGYLGGMNWGGVAVDRMRDLLVVNDIRVTTIVRLVPQAQLAGRIQANFSHAGYELHPQAGAPYGVELKSFMSPLGIPCEQPPWGMITAIDLRTRKIAWQIPAGTLSESLDQTVGLPAPIPIGMPTLSAALVTSTGLTFYSGTNDAMLRAWDTARGRELWRSKLPVGSQATPMSYVSPRSGRQYVVVVAGGAPYSPRKGDYIVAYALPEPVAPSQARER